MPTRNERLAYHYIAQSGIVAVQIEQTGPASFLMGWAPVVTISKPPATRRVFCCANSRDAVHLIDSMTPLIGRAAGFPAAVAALHDLAQREGIGITPHEAVVDRAKAVVAEVNHRFDLMKASFEIRSINREFKALRAAGAVATYADFIHSKKAEMLSAMARAL